jgi:hypothetical protein
VEYSETGFSFEKLTELQDRAVANPHASSLSIGDSFSILFKTPNLILIVRNRASPKWTFKESF